MITPRIFSELESRLTEASEVWVAVALVKEDAFQKIFSDLAKSNNAALVPFLLEGVGGKPELNLPDRIHPTAEGHKIVAENVWKILQPALEKMNPVRP